MLVRARQLRAMLSGKLASDARCPMLRAMENEDNRETSAQRQPVIHRLLWFFAGAGMNYLLIATPFKYLRTHTDWPTLLISACSVGVSTTFFFFWNYFVNFRTDARKRDAFARYLTAVIVLGLISTGLLAAFKSFNVLKLQSFPLDLDVVVLQLCFGPLKFLVYHKWAFPVAKQ